jgi:hydrogenase 3 maturation protease
MPDLREQLRQCLHGRFCLMGLGNEDYGDDAAGIRLAEELADGGMPDVMIAGNRPESFISRASGEGFEHIVFLDAVEFGGAPGSVVFLDSSEMTARFPQISTHKISLSVLAKWAEAGGNTRAWLLGVQPESLRAGRRLSAPVRTTLDVLKELLRELNPAQDAMAERPLMDGKAC